MSMDPKWAGSSSLASVLQAKIAGRTVVQVNGLDGDSRDEVMLLHPFGYWAVPVAGAKTIEFQNLGYSSLKYHLGGDLMADIPTDGQVGECGLARAGQQVCIRITGVEIVTPHLHWGISRAALKRLVHEEMVAFFNAHTHGGGPTPDQTMGAAQLTG